MKLLASPKLEAAEIYSPEAGDGLAGRGRGQAVSMAFLDDEVARRPSSFAHGRSERTISLNHHKTYANR